MLFALRNPSVVVTTYAIQLVAYPIGLAWDLIFPDRTFKVLGLSFNLRPGKFNFKEHVIITVMSNAAYGGGSLYATDVIIVQQVWYKQFFGWSWQILFGITTLCMGYGLAGLSRRFLVWPASNIWPGTLVVSQFRDDDTTRSFFWPLLTRRPTRTALCFTHFTTTQDPIPSPPVAGESAATSGS